MVLDVASINMASSLPQPLLASNRTMAAMEEGHREALRKSKPAIVADLDVSEIIDQMMQHGIINSFKQEIIMAKPTRHAQVRTFLDQLMRSSDYAFDVFVQALKDTYPHLAETVNSNLELYDTTYDFTYDPAPTPDLNSCEEHNTIDRPNKDCSNQSLVDPNYIDKISENIVETVCYQSVGTQSMVCKEACEAQVCNERLQTNRTNEGMRVVQLKKGDCLFLDEELKQKFREGKKESSHAPAWDKLGRLLLVPYWAITMHGDPCGETWFHPIPLSAEQASMILKPYARPGVFLVYVPILKQEGHNIKFNLSILTRKGNKFTTLHLHVNKDRSGHVEMENKSFSSVQELVEYHKANKGRLPCRLRFPPAEADRNIIKGEHYDEKWHVPEEELEFDGVPSHEASGRKVLRGYMDLLPVAVKYRSANHRLHLWSKENFFDEANILSKLDHRNIVQLRGFSFDSHVDPFIVMEFVEGGTLLDAVKNQKIDNKNVENVSQMFKQVLMALHYLESKNYVIHCNVRANNFLLGESNCLKLADFGNARMVSQDSFFIEENNTPVRWSAPEVLRNGLCSTKSDIWSAGVVLYEMLSDGKEVPYGKLTSSQIIDIVPTGGCLSCPGGHSAAMRDIFKVITHRCWKASPKERMAPSSLWDVISSRLSSNNESAKQAALSQGVYLPDPEEFEYLRSKHLKKGIVPRNLQRRAASTSGYDAFSCPTYHPIPEANDHYEEYYLPRSATNTDIYGPLSTACGRNGYTYASCNLYNQIH